MRISHEGKTPPHNVNTKRHEAFLRDLLVNLKDVEKEARIFFPKVAKENVITVLAINTGDVDTLVNWVCSARKHDIPLDNVLVFAGDPSAAAAAESLGLFSMNHKAFGKLPDSHAKQ